MTQRQARWLLVLCLVVGVVLIIMGPRWAPKSQPAPEPETATVGQATAVEGKVSRVPWNHKEAHPVTNDSNLNHLDRLYIESRSQIDLTVMGYKIRLLGPAEMILERWSPSDSNSAVAIHVVSGNLEMLTEGERGKVYVLKDELMTDPKGASLQKQRGLIISPLSLAASGALTVPVIDEAGTGTSVGTVALAGDNDTEPLPDSLSNAYLDGEIAKEQDQFQRCQANSLRDGGEVKGQVVIGMTITPQGKVQDVHIMTSTLMDDKLHGCVLGIFSRLKFRPFKGASIVRSYPLSFE